MPDLPPRFTQMLDEFQEIDLDLPFYHCGRSWPLRQQVNLLSLSASLGIHKGVSLLLDRGADINAGADEYETALGAVARSWGKGHILTLLLDRGADINAVGSFYGTALATAASVGNTGNLLLLLDRGADINAVGGEHGTALAAAAYEGTKENILLLLDRGADINAVGGKYGTALATAWQPDIVSLLLDRGADIDAVGGKYGTTLATAAYRANQHILLLLLDRGADVNAVGGKYGTALATAAYQGNGEIIWLLLERGADIDAVGGKYGTALATAREIDTVSLLLDLGADINAVGGKYGTALATAAYKGNRDIILLLLDQGADINAVGPYGSALAAASSQLDCDLVSLLLARGADLCGMRGIVGATLAVAVVMAGAVGEGSGLLPRPKRPPGDRDPRSLAPGHDARMFRLLSNQTRLLSQLQKLGQEGHAVSGKYGSALGLAAHFGDTETVSLLLGYWGDATRVGGAYRTRSGVYPNALDAAAAEGSVGSPRMHELLVNALGQPTSSIPDEVLAGRPPFPMPYDGPGPSGTYPPNTSAIQSTSPIPCDAQDIISPEQAEILCREVSEENLISSLVGLVGLQAGTANRLEGWIRSDVRYFIARNFDFGLAYAAARVAWKNFNEDDINDDSISAQRGRWHWHAKKLDSARSGSTQVSNDSELIQSPYSIMPRRIWDLKSNRVVEFRMLHAANLSMQRVPDPLSSRPAYWAISHSWTTDMHPTKTSVNEYQWPVPLPRNVDLGAQVRSELLSFGAEYIWLDVLCLRQQHADSGARADLDQLKMDEWKLDVPTIGNIYRVADRIVRYFNGIGVQFSPDGWDGTRHWLQRAWTLQEIRTEHTTINSGVVWGSLKSRVFMNTLGMVSGKETTLRRAIHPVLRLSEMVDSPRGCGVYELAREMARRHASRAVDKLSGLFYLLRTTELPCYNEKMTSEDFWARSFHLLPTLRKVEILFNFPYRGSDQQWFPTWIQMISWPERDPDHDHISVDSDLEYTTRGSFLVRNIWSLPSVELYPTRDSREYEVKIRDKFFGFYSPYVSQERINTNVANGFILVVPHLGNAYNWIVCEPVGTGSAVIGVPEVNILKKVGVLRTDSLSELLVGGEDGGSMLEQIDCEIV